MVHKHIDNLKKWNEFKDWFNEEFYCGRKFDNKINPAYFINQIGDKIFELDHPEEKQNAIR